MPRGPAPQSPETKRAKGNPGRRPIAPPPVVAEPVGDAKPDANLRPKARHVWNLLAPELGRLNVLRSTDSFALSRYCEDVAKYWEVTQKLRTLGDTYEVNSNHGKYTRINPLFAIQERLVARLIAVEDRFGLNPQARQAIVVRAAQIASQGTLPFGPNEPDTPGAPPPPVADDTPIGFLGAPTRH